MSAGARSTIRKVRLDNGLTVVMDRMEHVRSVSLGVWLRTGSRHETERQNGISHFIEHLVFKGTRRRSAQEIARIIDSIGGQVDAFTGKECTCFYTKVLDDHLTVAVDLLSDIVLSPRFAREDIEKERKVIYEEIRMVEDSPEELVYDLLLEKTWKDHPLGRPIQGTRRSVSALRSPQLNRYFGDSYRPENMVISAAGNFRHADLLRVLRKGFEPLLDAGAVNGKTRPPRHHAVVVRREKTALEQLHLCLGVPAPALISEERFTLLVLNTVLGGTMSSRLWQRIREGSGLAYSVYSGLNAYADCGFLTVYAATNPSSADLVIRQIVREMQRLKREPVPDKELRIAKDHLKGSTMLSLESSSSRMSSLARQEIYFGRQMGHEEVLRRIEAVTPAQMLELARRLFTGEHCALAAVGRLSRMKTRREELRF